MIRHHSILLLLLFVAALASCHRKNHKVDLSKLPSKDLVDTAPKTIVKDKIIIPIAGLPSTVEMDADIDIHASDFSQNVSAKIKFKKLDSTWISLTGIFGIEGARILVTKDTFHMLDRLNKKYIKGPVSQSYRYIPFQLDLLSFQHLLMGSITYPIDSSFYISTTKDTVYYEKNFKNIWRKSTWWKNKLINFTEKDLTSGYHINGILLETANHSTPYRRKYKITNHQQEYQIEFKVISYEANKPIDFKFEVSPRYERIEL